MINLRNCVFGFKCSAKWDDMAITSDIDVRHCEICKKNVYFITKDEDLISAIDLKRCVAIQTPEDRQKLDLMRPTLGLPVDYSNRPDSDSFDQFDDIFQQGKNDK
jgi:hypothetical protein